MKRKYRHYNPELPTLNFHWQSRSEGLVQWAPMKYFRLLGNLDIPDRWFLKGPIGMNGEALDHFIFLKGQILHPEEPIIYRIRREGRPIAITFADWDIPIALREVGEAITATTSGSLQLIPATIEHPETGENYVILNVTNLVKCICEKRSEIMYWKAEDGRPEKVGKYRMITKLVLEKSSVEGNHLFRIKGWEIALIASQQIKEKLEELGVEGVTFQELPLA